MEFLDSVSEASASDRSQLEYVRLENNAESSIAHTTGKCEQIAYIAGRSNASFSNRPVNVNNPYNDFTIAEWPFSIVHFDQTVDAVNYYFSYTLTPNRKRIINTNSQPWSDHKYNFCRL